MNGWIKKFANGKLEIGSDRDVKNRKASWTRGKLTDMVGVEVHHSKIILSISGTGSFWQSDDLEARVGINHSYNLITRRIQKQITEFDGILYINSLDNKYYFDIRPIDNIENGLGLTKIRLDDKVGKWLTVELDIKENKVIYDFKEDKI